MATNDGYRSQGRRTSKFPMLTEVPAGSLVPFVSGNTNYTITYSNFLDGLGVTGSIEQNGALDGIPVLDIQGSINAIRNLELGVGLGGQISPDNGIALEFNYAQAGGATPIVRLNGDQLIFQALAAGSGIELQQDSINNRTTIVATGDLPATNVVRVNTESDFPAPVLGVITLEDDTTYIMSNDVTTSSRFVMGQNASLVSNSYNAPTLTYTGTETMFSGVDINCLFQSLRVSCPSAEVWDISSTGAPFSILNIDDVRVDNCLSLGAINDLRGCSITGLRVVDAGQGLVILGSSWENFSFVSSFINSSSPAFVALDFSAAVFNALKLDGSTFSAPLGSVAFAGSIPAENNITSGNLGIIEGNSFRGGMVPLSSGFEPQLAIRWSVQLNDQIRDTRPDALISFFGNSAATVIGGAGVDELVNATWVVGETAQFIGGATGSVQYIGEVDVRLPIDLTASISKIGGGTQNYTIVIYKNGSPIENTRKTFEIEAGALVSVTTIWQDTFVNGDTYEVYVSNETNANNVVVEQAVFRVN